MHSTRMDHGTCSKRQKDERKRDQPDVAADECGVQAERIHSREYASIQRRANRVQQLLERMPRERLRDIAPEKAQQLIAAATAFPGCREHGQERQPAALVSMIAENRFVCRSDESERSERPKTESWHRGCLAGGGIHELNLGRQPGGVKEQL